MSFQLSSQVPSPASGKKCISNKIKGISKHLFGHGVDKEVRMSSPLDCSNSHFHLKKTHKEHRNRSHKRT